MVCAIICLHPLVCSEHYTRASQSYKWVFWAQVILREIDAPFIPYKTCNTISDWACISLTKKSWFAFCLPLFAGFNSKTNLWISLYTLVFGMFCSDDGFGFRRVIKKIYSAHFVFPSCTIVFQCQVKADGCEDMDSLWCNNVEEFLLNTFLCNSGQVR
jgi:hypothetical protein